MKRRQRALEVFAAVAVLAVVAAFVLHQVRGRHGRDPAPTADATPAPADVPPSGTAEVLSSSTADPTAWAEVPAPARGTAAFEAARESRRVWVVSEEEGRVVARLREGDPGPGPGVKPGPEFDVQVEDVPDLFSPTCAARVEDGWLVGFSGGEWGGGLWWFSTGGRTNYRVARGNINDLVRAGAGTFAVEGLNHLWSRGSVLRLAVTDGKWAADEFVKLPRAGLAATGVGNDLVVVTDRGVVRVTREGRVQPLVEGVTWVDDPTSVVLARSGTLYVGMPGSVAAVGPGKPPAVRFLVPSKEFLKPGK